MVQHRETKAITSEEAKASTFGPYDAPLPTERPTEHPWQVDLDLPKGMFSPQPDRVAVRPLTLVGKVIKIADIAKRVAGWFMVGFPGDLDDPEQKFAQEMVIAGEAPDGTPIETIIGPGDLVAASEFQCWPVDVVRERWRLCRSEDVVMIIKQGTEQYEEMLLQYAPFCNETDADVQV